MSSKTFNILSIVTLVLLVWAIVLGARSRSVVIEFIRGQELVPEIDTGRLTKIEITKGDAADAKVVLEKRGDTFLVVSRNSYPADTGRINNLIQQCTGITCDREIADSADVHGELEVDGKAAESTVVRFFDGEAEMVGVVVGKSEGSGRYVRLTNDVTVYLSEESVFLDTDALMYVDKDLTSLESIKRVKVTGAGDAYEIVQKDKDSSPQLQGVPDGMAAKASMVGQVFNACKNLTFADFFSEVDIKDVEFKHGYVAETESGELYTVQLGKKGEDWMCTVRARYVGPQSLTIEEVKAAKDDPDKMKQHEATLQAGKKVEAFNNRHQSWVYKLAGYNAETLTKPFKDLIEEDKNFLQIDEKKIETVTVTKVAASKDSGGKDSGGKDTGGKDTGSKDTGSKDGASYTIESPEPGVVRIRDVPQGKDERPFLAGSVFRAPATLTWQTRLKPDDEQLEGVEFDTVYKATMRDKSVYTFLIGKKDGKSFLKADAVFTGEDKDAGPDADIAKGAVAKFQQRHAGHVYEVSPGSVDNMVRGLDELIKDASELPAEIAASHILVSYKEANRSTSDRTKDEAKARAEQLLADVNKEGADFAKIAEANSDGPSKTKGGDLGRFTFDKMAKPFSDAAFKLEVGGISGVVETEFGFHIIKRTQ